MALFNYASDGNYAEVDRLSSLPDINLNFMFNNISILQIAIMSGNVDIVRLLIERGANVNMSDPTVDTPLIMSIKMMKYDITRMLLEGGADKYDQSFYVALQTQDVTAMYELLRSGETDLQYLENVYAAAKDADAQMLLYLMKKMVPEVSDEPLTFPLQVQHDGRILSLSEENAEKIYSQLESGSGPSGPSGPAPYGPSLPSSSNNQVNSNQVVSNNMSAPLLSRVNLPGSTNSNNMYTRFGGRRSAKKATRKAKKATRKATKKATRKATRKN